MRKERIRLTWIVMDGCTALPFLDSVKGNPKRSHAFLRDQQEDQPSDAMRPKASGLIARLVPPWEKDDECSSTWLT
jgi:hypothetical protein